MKRRPSFAAIVALLALFVALGGPAEAQRLLGKGDVRSREVKDRSLKLRDLERRTVRALRATVNNSITEAKLANGSVTPGKLAPGAVGSAAIGDRSIGTADLMTGAVARRPDRRRLAERRRPRPVLRALQRAQHRSRSRRRVGVPARGEPRAASGPSVVGADISDDLVIVNPDAGGRTNRCR